MKNNILCVLFSLVFMVSCVSIPRETIELSKAMETDLQSLHEAHRNTVLLYYNRIKADIGSFVNDVYAPYVIRYVLESELTKYKEGEPSLYGTIEAVGKKDSETETAVEVMLEFQEAANNRITAKKAELLSPVLQQEREILNQIDRSYQSVIYANMALTAYLSSVRKLKETRDETLSGMGIKEGENSVTGKIMELSRFTDAILQKAKQIDIQNDQAEQEIDGIIGEIKKLTNTTEDGK